MADWSGFIIAVSIGTVLLAAASLLDLSSKRRREGLVRPPERGDERVDSLAPSYVSKSQVDAASLPRGPALPKASRAGSRLKFGHLAPEFATDGDEAVLTDAAVLMVDGTVTTIRELLDLLGAATTGRPLILAATGMESDVLDTLKANRRMLRTPVVATQPPVKDLYELRQVVGGEVLTPADLKAGYVPPSALGAAESWTSTLTATWVVSAPKPEPEVPL